MTSSITVVATDDNRRPVSSEKPVTVAVTNVNEGPVADAVLSIEMTAGNTATSLDPNEIFTDPDGDKLTYTLEEGDENLAVATATVEDAVLSITPLGEGTASFVVTASDPSGLSETGIVEVFPSPLPHHSRSQRLNPSRRLRPRPP